MTTERLMRFHPDVVSDLREAIRWYGEISAPLANRFRKRVDASFQRIAENPDLYPRAFDSVRFCRLRTFPYLVLYRSINDIPHVLGVFHGASDPTKWRQRAADV
ncbi:MAG: type II toxin-antitoxin system RelE/ParE family toxin [Planctomycetota bacterium]|nr:MAG: type II toxin-antitoxin system RelE/ParE family toxin [Planctomycetota bacterium]REJ91582.1 MAG: type II toxin-antitoxin system RelE/ParE family toxin [Planctomycetota bacterium]